MDKKKFLLLSGIAVVAMLCIICFATGADTVVRFIAPGLTLLIIGIVVLFRIRSRGDVASYFAWRRRKDKNNKNQASPSTPNGMNLSEILSKLNSAYIVINKYEKKHSRINHVVIGPTGIFIIESKDVRGTLAVSENGLLLDGKHGVDHYIETVRTNARTINSEFKTFNKMKKLVKPVLCFTNAVVTSNPGKMFGDVLITTTGDLVKIMEGYPQLLEMADVTGIFLYLKKGARYESCRNMLR